MVVDNKHRNNLFINDQDEPQSSSENGPDSPYSGDELKNITTTTKKRRNIQKKVVTVSIGDQVDGLRSKGEAYPPSDSWAWRKYGQKPIKGSPYPRGYYRCSSFKGCPARKQVERNRVDPTKLVVTYASEHNHPLPTTKHHNHYHNRHNNHQSAATAATSNVTTTTSDGPTNSADLDDPSSPTMQINPFGDQSPQLEFVGDTLVLGNLGVEYCWISDVSFHTPSFMGPTCDDMEGVVFTMKEEDESLFGDLDELPECSTVFRKKFQRCTATSTPLYNTR